MLTRMIKKSLVKNIRLTIWTLVTLSTCAALVTMFTTIFLDVNKKMSSTLRRLGANALAYYDSHLMRENHPSSWQTLEKMVRQERGEMVPLYVQVGTIKSKPVAVVWADPEKLSNMTPYWKISGRRALAAGECLVGKGVADGLQLKTDMVMEISGIGGNKEKTDYRIAGIFNAGDEDENRIFLPVSTTGVSLLPDKNISSGLTESNQWSYALLSLPRGEEQIERLGGQILNNQEGIKIKPFRQILYGEKNTLNKITLLSGLSLLTVIILTSLGVSSSVLARIVERRKELALMQALGASRRSIVGFLLLESAVQGALASLAGFGIGLLLSQIVVQQIFHVSITPSGTAFLITSLTTVGVALLSGGFGAGRSLRIQPALALKGE